MKANAFKTPAGLKKYSFFTDATRQIFKEMIANFNTFQFRSSEKSSSNNAYIEDEHDFEVIMNNVSNSNTVSEVGVTKTSNEQHHQEPSESVDWPERKTPVDGCNGHECLANNQDINKRILYKPLQQKLKPNFTPPIFSHSGILTCPDVNPDRYKDPMLGDKKQQTTVLEDSTEYMLPGNMEFIEFTYPTIQHLFRYSTFAKPYDRDEWQWILKHMYKIRNSFRRKYHCEVTLASKPGMFKGKPAYLVRIEGDSQGNILRCRSGLPQSLKEIMVTPLNAINDVNCFVTEYLIKRKLILQSSQSYKDSYDKGLDIHLN